MFGGKRGRGLFNPPPQVHMTEAMPPQQRMRASFGGSRGEDVISRRLDRQDPVVTPEDKSAALEAISEAVRHAQEIGATDYEINSAVRGFNTVTRNAQRGNDDGQLLPEEPYRPHRQGDESGPYPGGDGL